MATLVKADGTRSEITPKDGTSFKFEGELYPIIAPVSKMIEVITLQHGFVMLMDEEGKRQPGAVRNELGTALLMGVGGQPGDFIVGDIIIATRREAGFNVDSE